MLSDSSMLVISNRSGWVMGTEMVPVPVTAVPVSVPVPVMLTVMLATPPV